MAQEILRADQIMNVTELETLFSALDREIVDDNKFVHLTASNKLEVVQPANGTSGSSQKSSLRRTRGGGSRSAGAIESQSVDLNKVEIPDSYIDERIASAIEKSSVGYLPEAKIAQIGASQYWEVESDYTYRVNYASVGRGLSYKQKKALTTTPADVPHLCNLTAPKGFLFDRASVPRPFWAIISKDDLSSVPALFHDLLYAFGGEIPAKYVEPQTEFSKAEADNLFLYLLELTGVKSWRTRLAYQAVVRFGDDAWGKRRREALFATDR